MKKVILFFVKPYGIVLITVTMSLFAWLIPNNFGFWKGFDRQEEVTFNSLFIFISWYSLIMFLSYLGYKFGLMIKVNTQKFESVKLNKSTPFYILSFFSWIGLLASILSVINKMGIEGIILSMIDFSLNMIEEALYEDYAVGIYSLRYTIIIVFGISLYKIYKRENTKLCIFNILLFIVYTIIFGKRLQILCGLFIFLSYFSSDKDLIGKLKVKNLIINFLIVIILFVVASTLRGFNTFANLGFENALSLTFANVVLYLAAPMQGFITIANRIGFDYNTFDFFSLGTISYDLNTNSGFSFIVMSIKYSDFGINRTFLPYHGYGLALGYLYISAISLFYSFLLGILWKLRSTYFFNAYGVILYAFGEIWRIDLFSVGIFFTLLIISTFVAIIVFLFNSVKVKF